MGYAQVDGVPKVFQLVGDTRGGYQLRRYTGDAKKVIIPEGVGIVMIQPNAFQYKNAETVIIPEGVQRIETEAFLCCGRLKEVILPSSLKYVGWDAFRGCSSLSSVALPNGLLEIGRNAFERCNKLKDDYIPSSVKKIGSGAFGSQATTEIAPGVQAVGDALIRYTGEASEVIIPDSIRIIADAAFGDCKSVAAVHVGANVKIIGSDAFSRCENLRRVYIEDGVEVIGDHCFQFCSHLEDVRLPETIKELNTRTFCGCRNLKELRLPNGITAIHEGAFSNCNSLTRISLPDQLSTIDRSGIAVLPTIPSVIDFPLKAQETLGTKVIREAILTYSLLRKYLVEETDYSSFEQEITNYLRLKSSRTRLLKEAVKKDDFELIKKLIAAYPMTLDELQKMNQLAKDFVSSLADL